MSYHWSNLRIQNYKSIKDLQMDCGTINVFIGPPNSGKSNILEALELPSLSYIMPQDKNPFEPDSGFLDCKKLFRVDTARQLFYFGDTRNTISIEGVLDNGDKSFSISQIDFNNTLDTENYLDQPERGISEFNWTNWHNDTVPFSSDFISSPNARYSFFGRSYRYPLDFDFENSQNFYFSQLQPPYGINLGATIMANPHLQEMVRELTKETGFDLVVDDATGRMSLQIGTRTGFAVSLPYRALSDTLRRMIFYISAIRTSRNKILILEEPEALSFPPYITWLAEEIIQSSSEKQFFISTHSPFILNEFIENVDKEKLAVFVCHYSLKEKQTKARRLTPEELTEIQNFGVDLFFNLKPYLNDHSEHSA